ncbi:MAG TPA: restriction endonuclease [Rhizobacter sp.]
MSTTKIGTINTRISARGRVSYEVEVSHDGLSKYRLIKGDTFDIVDNKARMQAQEWDQRWTTTSEREERRSQREESRQQVLDRMEEADERTQVATEQLDAVRNHLIARLDDDMVVDWASRKRCTPFPEPEPAAPRPQPKPVKASGRPMPPKDIYLPRLSWLDKLFAKRARQRIEAGEAKYAAALQQWEQEGAQLAALHAKALAAHQDAEGARQRAYETAHAAWIDKRQEWEAQEAEHNASVDAQQAAYLAKEPEAITDYCLDVLTGGTFPEDVYVEFALDYEPVSRMLLVEATLPTPENLPRLKAVKYLARRDDFEDVFISEAEVLRLYDGFVYQVALRALHEVFAADAADAIDAVVFNGMVDTNDRRTGAEIRPCILSLQVTKAAFLDVNLRQVEPKECFRAFKGVGSSKLSAMVPVAPVMQWNADDRRFVEGYGVADRLDDGVNLAAMDWEDFEHLIRELFEMEFAAHGAEVKITQSSRDGGVDAVVFDPDPLRGGKMIIQAKCYTNTVNVSHVRDLYGTVIHEKATRGILVTTSNFGLDSHEFVKEKPLLLIDGSNLLAILEKHQRKAYIDLHDAKLQKRTA